jgi:hypothetical protein
MTNSTVNGIRIRQRAQATGLGLPTVTVVDHPSRFRDSGQMSLCSWLAVAGSNASEHELMQ